MLVRVLAFAFAALFTFPAAPAAEIPERLPHGPIWIRGDLGFLDPSNGVVAGSGTAEDPYVIHGWDIHMLPFGIVLEGTRAHVVIENVRLEGGLVGVAPDCAALGGSCPAVDLLDAQNVTVRGIEPVRASTIVRMEGSAHVLVADVDTGPNADPEALLDWRFVAFDVEDSRDVRIERIRVREFPSALEARSTDGLVLSRWSVEGAAMLLLDHSMGDVRIEDSAFARDIEIVYGFNGDGRVESLAVVRSSFADNAQIASGSNGNYGSVFLCGNVFTGNDLGHYSVYLRGALHEGRVRVVGNSFEDTGGRFSIHDRPRDVEMSRNLLRNSLGVRLYADVLHMQGNSFDRNRGTFDLYPGEADIRGNWWGDASGPSGIGPGSGDRITSPFPSNIVFDPWLTSAPVLTPVDCAAEEARPWN